jgi:hypothetical protein
VFVRGLAGLAGVGMLRTIGLGSLATLAGCDVFGAGEQAPDPEPATLQDLLSATATLGDRYSAALATTDSLPTTVGQIRDAHRAHARALAQAIGAPTPRPSTSVTNGSGKAAPASREATLAALVAAEKDAHADAVAECLASSSRFAGLLGSIAAARATHLVALQ